VKKLTYFINYTAIVVLLLLFSSRISAQQQYDSVTVVDDQGQYLDFKSGWFFGADAGTTLFYGDVTTYNVFPKFSDFNKSFGHGISLFGGKQIKWGLSGEIQVSSGSLKGTKTDVANIPFFFNGDYQSYSLSAKYNISDLYLRKFGKRSNGKNANRMNVYFTVGGGQVFYRSRLYYVAGNRLKQAYGYTETLPTQPTGQYLLEKSNSLSSIIIPVGVKFQHKLNYKTDLSFDFYYVNTFTDKLDAWERSWSHEDRYLYMAVGLVYHFGRREDSDEVPKSLRVSSEKKEVSNDDASEAGDSAPRKGLFGRRSRKSNSTDNDDLNLRLKLFDTQLKLFEMQNMIDNKK